MQNKLLFFIFLYAVVSCGGGGSNSNLNTNTNTNTNANNSISTEVICSEIGCVAGRAIDGYISGATIFWDLNWNLNLDDGEPYTQTSEGGIWMMDPPYLEGTTELDTEALLCRSHRPLVANVPVGAVDETEGLVQEEYQLVELIWRHDKDFTRVLDSFFLTPYSTLYVNAIRQVLSETSDRIIEVEDGCGISAEQIYSAVDSLLEENKNVIESGLTATETDEINSDFIKSENEILQNASAALAQYLQLINSIQDAVEAYFSQLYGSGDLSGNLLTVDPSDLDQLLSDPDKITQLANHSVWFNADIEANELPEGWTYQESYEFLGLTLHQSGYIVSAKCDSHTGYLSEDCQELSTEDFENLRKSSRFTDSRQEIRNSSLVLSNGDIVEVEYASQRYTDWTVEEGNGIGTRVERQDGRGGIRTDLSFPVEPGENFTCMEQNNLVVQYDEENKRIYSYVEARNLTPIETCSLLDTNPWLFYGVEVRPSSNPIIDWDGISISLYPDSTESSFLNSIPPLERTNTGVENIVSYVEDMKNIPKEVSEESISFILSNLQQNEGLTIEQRPKDTVEGVYHYARELEKYKGTDSEFRCQDIILTSSGSKGQDINIINPWDCFDYDLHPLDSNYIQ